MKIFFAMLLTCILAFYLYADQNGVVHWRSHSIGIDGQTTVMYCANPCASAPYYRWLYSDKPNTDKIELYNEVVAKASDFVGKDYNMFCDELIGAGCSLCAYNGYGREDFQKFSKIGSSAAFFYTSDGKHYVLCANLYAYIPIGTRIIQKIEFLSEKLIELNSEQVVALTKIRDWHSNAAKDYMHFVHYAFLKREIDDYGVSHWSFAGERLNANNGE